MQAKGAHWPSEPFFSLSQTFCGRSGKPGGRLAGISMHQLRNIAALASDVPALVEPLNFDNERASAVPEVSHPGVHVCGGFFLDDVEVKRWEDVTHLPFTSSSRSPCNIVQNPQMNYADCLTDER